MADTEVLENFISNLRVKLGDAAFRIAELETLLLLEQAKTKKLEIELEQKTDTLPSQLEK